MGRHNHGVKDRQWPLGMLGCRCCGQSTKSVDCAGLHCLRMQTMQCQSHGCAAAAAEDGTRMGKRCFRRTREGSWTCWLEWIGVWLRCVCAALDYTRGCSCYWNHSCSLVMLPRGCPTQPTLSMEGERRVGWTMGLKWERIPQHSERACDMSVSSHLHSLWCWCRVRLYNSLLAEAELGIELVSKPAM